MSPFDRFFVSRYFTCRRHLLERRVAASCFTRRSINARSRAFFLPEKSGVEKDVGRNSLIFSALPLWSLRLCGEQALLTMLKTYQTMLYWHAEWPISP